MKTQQLFLFLALIFSAYLMKAQWVQLGDDLDGSETQPQFGNNLSFSNDGVRLAVTSRGNPAQVRIFKLLGNTWTRIGNELNSNGAYDGFGSSLSLSADGTRLALGIPFNDESEKNAGKVSVYEDSMGMRKRAFNLLVNK